MTPSSPVPEERDAYVPRGDPPEPEVADAGPFPADADIEDAGSVDESTLWRLADQIWGSEEELRAAGLALLGEGPMPDEDLGVVDVQCIGLDREGALHVLRERFGPRIRVDWLGPEAYRPVARAFGTWTAEERELTVFYGIDRNGERERSRAVVEDAETVTVTVTISRPVGGTSLIGGHRLCEATVSLAAPLAGRLVVDGSTGRERPSLAAWRARR